MLTYKGITTITRLGSTNPSNRASEIDKTSFKITALAPIFEQAYLDSYALLLNGHLIPVSASNVFV